MRHHHGTDCAKWPGVVQPRPLLNTAHAHGSANEPVGGHVHCAYCGVAVAAGRVGQVPAVDDEEAWTVMRRYHYRACPWITTLAQATGGPTTGQTG